MKKYICLLLVVVLLFSFLGGCQKAVPEPEGVPSEITVIVTPKPEPEVEEPEVEEEPEPEEKYNPLIDGPRDLDIGPEREEFFYALKEPWGKKDLALYDGDGSILIEAKPGDNETREIWAYLEEYNEGLTYRGIALGDDSYNALKHMDIPKEAFLMLSRISWPNIYVPYDLEKLYDYVDVGGYDVELVCLYLDVNYKPIEVLNSPYTDYFHTEEIDGIQVFYEAALNPGKAGAHVVIGIHINNETANDFVIHNYYATYFS